MSTMSARRIALYRTLPPSLDLNFLSGLLDPRITFTRAAGPATYFDAAGVLQTAGTNVPRFDYDPATLAPRGLLIEEARTNLLTNSQAINSWPTKTDLTVTDNSTTSPDSTVNASLITEGSAGTSLLISNVTTGLIAGSTISYSLYVKRGNTDIIRVLATDTGTANGINIWLNLATGAVLSSTIRGTATAISATMTPISNGWYRLTATCTQPVGSTSATFAIDSASANGGSTRVAGATYYVWGGQIEVGAFPTSYIPTTVAAATRAADVATMPVGPWFNAAQGTLVVEAIGPPFGPANNPAYAAFDAGSSANMFELRSQVTANDLRLTSFVANAGAGTTSAVGGPTTGIVFKGGFAYDAVKVIGLTSLNGNPSGVNGITGLASAITTLRIGPSRGSSPNTYIRRVTYDPRALPPAQLQARTR
jgi:hypothetical protein